MRQRAGPKGVWRVSVVGEGGKTQGGRRRDRKLLPLREAITVQPNRPNRFLSPPRTASKQTNITSSVLLHTVVKDCACKVCPPPKCKVPRVACTEQNVKRKGGSRNIWNDPCVFFHEAPELRRFAR